MERRDEASILRDVFGVLLLVESVTVNAVDALQMASNVMLDDNFIVVWSILKELVVVRWVLFIASQMKMMSSIQKVMCSVSYFVYCLASLSLGSCMLCNTHSSALIASSTGTDDGFGCAFSNLHHQAIMM